MELITSYHEKILDPIVLHDKANQLAAEIRKARMDHLPIAVRGVSGLVMGGALSSMMRRPLIVVRKGERSHSSHYVEGPKNVSKYIIIDDIVESGKTIREIHSGIVKAYRHPPCTPHLQGIFLYGEARSHIKVWAKGYEGGYLWHDSGKAMIRGLLRGFTLSEIDERWEKQRQLRTQRYNKKIDESGLTTLPKCATIMVDTASIEARTVAYICKKGEAN